MAPDPAVVMWGHRPTPLLPGGLRSAWARETLPDWVASELGLPADATFAALDANAWRTMAGDEVPKHVRAFLVKRLEERLGALNRAPLIGREWPAHVKPRDVPWCTRTWNCLAQAGLLDHPDRLAHATAWELRRVKNMGPVSILDFACAAEATFSGAGAGARPIGRVRTEYSTDDDWRDWVDAADPRFRRLVTIDAGTLGEHARLLRRERHQLAAVTREFRAGEHRAWARLTAIRAMSIEDAIVDLVAAAAGLQPDEAGALIRRLGLTGEPPLTRRTATALTGVSVWRLNRQREAFFAKLPDGPVFLPQLDAAIQLLEVLAPCPVDTASDALRARGLTTTPAAVALVLRAARLFRRATTLHVDESTVSLRSGEPPLARPEPPQTHRGRCARTPDPPTATRTRR